MISPDVIQRTQRFLFASTDEMQRAHLSAPVVARLLRIRDIYSYWLVNPNLPEREIIKELRARYHLSATAAYEDLRLVKICLGNLNQNTIDYYRWLFLQRCEESFQMARKYEDPKAFAATLATLGKYTRLDTPENERPDYSQIVPQQFDITSDPEAAGFKRIPDIEKKVKKLLSRYITDTVTPPSEASIVTPLKPILRHGSLHQPT